MHRIASLREHIPSQDTHTVPEQQALATVWACCDTGQDPSACAVDAQTSSHACALLAQGRI